MEIHLDYATFNFDSDTMNQNLVAKALLGDHSDLHCSYKCLNENSPSVSPFGLSWLNNSGFAPRPHRLQVSGLGCDNFFYVLPNLVSMCNNNGGECSFSRLDFAFDVIIKRDEWKKFISSAFESSLSSDRVLKKYTLAGSGEAMTVYIGSRTSPRFFRIYNKTLEDKSYIYKENGIPKELPDDSCVIRYEVELKRKLWNREGKKVVVDPSPLFYQYYSGDDELAEYIKELWLSFGDDVLLPGGFSDANLTLLSKNKNFASISLQNAHDLTEERVYNEPYSFTKVTDYVVDKFGKYIPFIVANLHKFQICEDKAKTFIGFLPYYPTDYFVNTGLTELEDSD